MTDQKIKELETKKVKETKETEKKPAAKKKTAAKSSAKSATAKTKTSGKKAAPKKDAAPQKTTAEWITEFEALAKKNSGVLTYKEIQDRMQNTDSISVDEMDEIYSKLAEKNIEVVDDHAEEEEPENMDDEELTWKASSLRHRHLLTGNLFIKSSKKRSLIWCCLISCCRAKVESKSLKRSGIRRGRQTFRSSC